jgi:hypothetical protein
MLIKQCDVGNPHVLSRYDTVSFLRHSSIIGRPPPPPPFTNSTGWHCVYGSHAPPRTRIGLEILVLCGISEYCEISLHNCVVILNDYIPVFVLSCNKHKTDCHRELAIDNTFEEMCWFRWASVGCSRCREVCVSVIWLLYIIWIKERVAFGKFEHSSSSIQSK